MEGLGGIGIECKSHGEGRCDVEASAFPLLQIFCPFLVDELLSILLSVFSSSKSEEGETGVDIGNSDLSLLSCKETSKS